MRHDSPMIGTPQGTACSSSRSQMPLTFVTLRFWLVRNLAALTWCSWESLLCRRYIRHHTHALQEQVFEILGFFLSANTGPRPSVLIKVRITNGWNINGNVKKHCFFQASNCIRATGGHHDSWICHPGQNGKAKCIGADHAQQGDPGHAAMANDITQCLSWFSSHSPDSFDLLHFVDCKGLNGSYWMSKICQVASGTLACNYLKGLLQIQMAKKP